MKRKMKKLAITLALLCAVVSTSAQSSTLYSAYFLDGMVTRHQLNAALMPTHGYFSLPVLGNFNMTVGTNMGVGTWIYPSSDSDVLNTFLHPDVSSEEFEKNLSKAVSGIDLNLDVSLLHFGFYKWGGFNTFETSLHTDATVNIASDLFRFIKNGQSSDVTTYDLSGTGVNVNAYAEIALGHSRKIGDKLTVGLKLKYLAGLANANVEYSKFDLTLSDDEWKIYNEISGNLSLAGSEVSISTDDDMTFDYDLASAGLAGAGFAVDFGATYEVFDWLVVSAAVNDLGFIKWKNGNTLITTSGNTFVYDGFSDIDVEDFDIDDQLDDLGSQLEALIDFSSESNAPEYTTWLTTEISAGAELFVPGRKKYSLGLLYTTNIYNTYTTHRGMASLNLKLKWLNIAASYSLSSYGHNFGGVFNLCPKGFNLFLGMDYGVPRMTTSFIPVDESFGLNLSFGLNFTFGQRNKYNQ